MKVKVDFDYCIPERAHDTDAGIDLKATASADIMGFSSEVFGTGVHVQLPHGTCGILVSKSGLNVKHNLTSTGLIDEGYTGEIMVKLYNHSNKPYHVTAGDKISQLIIVPVLYEDLEFVDDLDCDSERGDNGFGSTGK